MERIFTRRSLVSAAPAALLAAAVPALASEHPDAALLALRAQWLVANAAYDATFDPLAAAERLCWGQQPNLPEYRTFNGTWTEFEAERHRVLSIRQALEVQTGVLEAVKRQSAACTAMNKVADEIFDRRAETLDGIRFKIDVLVGGYADCEVPEYDASLLADLLRFVGVHDA